MGNAWPLRARNAVNTWRGVASAPAIERRAALFLLATLKPPIGGIRCELCSGMRSHMLVIRSTSSRVYHLSTRSSF